MQAALISGLEGVVRKRRDRRVVRSNPRGRSSELPVLNLQSTMRIFDAARILCTIVKPTLFKIELDDDQPPVTNRSP